MNALELQNEQRAAVKLNSGGKRCAQRRMWRTFCFRGMLSTVHSGTSLLLIGHLKPMRKAASKGNFRDPCSRRPPHSLYAVLRPLAANRVPRLGVA